jgi:membrane-associated protein
MELIQQFFSTVYNVPELIRVAGFYGLILIVFAETGLLVGFFLPGDSLLITAGLFAARGDFNILTLIPTLVAAAIVGNATGYAIGKRTGRALYSRPDSLLFRKEHLRLTHEFYERHGGKTIILARFVPIVRTYVPFVAGVGAMPYLRYLAFCVAGAVIWVGSLCTAGYFFGNIPLIKNNLTVVILAIVLLSISPGIFAWLNSRRMRSRSPSN